MSTIDPMTCCLNILMEATPQEIDISKLEIDILSCTNVLLVSDLHVWSMSPNNNIMTVEITSNDHVCCAKEIENIAKLYKINHVTIENKCVKC